ncbi:MAG: ABC transporter substrate-binding protein, partial [Ignavibacteria bacterium]|nr:ABC transporter substrate-binding protein [Ignavibacteria bacterium]
MKIRYIYNFNALFLVLALGACNQSAQQISSVESLKIELQPDYAKGYNILNINGLKQLRIHSPWVVGKELSVFYLWPDSIPLPDTILPSEVIFTPLQRVAALSATQWGPMLRLGKGSIIKGVSEARFIQNNEMLQLVQNDLVKEVASEGGYKLEELVAIQADLVMYSPDIDGIGQSLLQTGLKFLAWPDYFETNPLGRAEWIRLLGILVGKEQKSNQLFDSIEHSYNHLKRIANQTTSKPTIFADKIFAGQWYVPGGESYIATIFKDAGATYVFADNTSTASFTLDLEAIFNKAVNADYWRIAHAASADYSYNLLKNENELYADFEAFKSKKVIFCNTAETAY